MDKFDDPFIDCFGQGSKMQRLFPYLDEQMLKCFVEFCTQLIQPRDFIILKGLDSLLQR